MKRALVVTISALMGLLVVAQASPSVSWREELRKRYAQTLRERPGDRVALGQLRQLEFDLGTHQRFITFLDSTSQRLEMSKGSDELSRAYLRIARAEALVAMGERQAGTAQLRQLLGSQNEVVVAVAQAFARSGLEQEAIKVYLDLRRRNGDPEAFSVELIDLFERELDFAAAAREAVRLVNRNPGSREEYARRLESYVARSKDPDGQRASQVRAVLDVLEGLQDDRLRQELRFRLLLASGRGREALAGLEQELDPGRWLGLAQYCETRGELAVAGELFHRLGYYSDQARVLRKLGKPSEAMAVLERDSSARARFELAELQRAQEDWRSAARNYELALLTDPSQDSAYTGWAACLIKTGDFAGARNVLAKMPVLTESGLLQLAHISFYAKDFQSCDSLVRELTRLYPQSTLVPEALGLSLLIAMGGQGLITLSEARASAAQGQYRSAIELCRLLVNDSSWADQAYLLIAESYRSLGEPGQALGALAEFEAKFPGKCARAQARYLAASIYRDELGNNAEYRRLMTSVFVDFPDTPYSALARNLLIPPSRPRE
ncbi:MAG: tetratricopeptide repeat protein [candidate division WOR-3 bacterium]